MTASTAVPIHLRHFRVAGPLTRTARATFRPVAKAGHIIFYFGQVLASIPTMLRRYRQEMLRLLADIAWGNGSIVVGGGTVNVAVVLGMTAGALSALEGYNFLNLVGLGPATGLLSSFATTRELAPVLIGMAFVAQAGCRFTAQLGAMRINDEIDALESMAINPIPFLATTRVVASVIAIVPLFMVALAVAYLSSQLVSVVAGVSTGSYLHYFSLFISGRDVLFATIKATVFVFIAATIQSYFGFYASARGGPAGVGIAAGHAMRSTVTVIMIVNMLLTMGLWGVQSGARFGG